MKTKTLALFACCCLPAFAVTAQSNMHGKIKDYPVYTSGVPFWHLSFMTQYDNLPDGATFKLMTDSVYADPADFGHCFVKVEIENDNSGGVQKHHRGFVPLSATDLYDKMDIYNGMLSPNPTFSDPFNAVTLVHNGITKWLYDEPGGKDVGPLGCNATVQVISTTPQVDKRTGKLYLNVYIVRDGEGMNNTPNQGWIELKDIENPASYRKTRENDTRLYSSAEASLLLPHQ